MDGVLLLRTVRERVWEKHDCRSVKMKGARQQEKRGVAGCYVLQC